MTEDIKQINLNTSVPAGVQKSGKGRKAVKTILVVCIVFLVIIVFGIGVLALALLPLRGVYAKAQVLATSAKSAASAAKSQDLEGTKTALAQTRKDLDAVTKEYAKVNGLSQIPFLGAYIKDGQHGLVAAKAGLDAADTAIEALEPNADLLGLKGGSKFVSGSADERIQTAVKTMEALTPKIAEMASSVDTIRKEIDSIDPNRYPVSFRGTPIRAQMKSAKDGIENAANLFVNAQPLLTRLPAILGQPNERRYLVLFQNDKELRPTGGFITAYARFRIVKGKIILEKADDIYALDAAKTKTFPAPPEILKFHKGVYTLNIRDSNLSPDFKISMVKFEEMYNTTSSKEKIDGIIAVDTHVLVEALKILGPMNVYGREFSADIDKRCDCPRAVYELEDYSTRPVGYVREARKDIIGVLLQQLMQKALGVSPSKYWGNLFQMMLSEINRKHVLAYFKDLESQKAIENFNMAGRIMTADETAALLSYKEGSGWDYLHINNANMAGAKSNMFVSDKVTKDTTLNSDGTATTNLTIEYKNPYPGSDCGLESGGLCLNAPLRNWLRIYVPKGSKLKDSRGTISPKDAKPIPLDTYDSLEKTVFEGFLIVSPLGSAKVELTYTSPVKRIDGKYKILIQKQPGTEGTEYSVKLAGSERTKFTIVSDTELSLAP